MAARKVTAPSDIPRVDRPALTPESRENQLIALAIDCVEERLRAGTASPSEIVHFLKLASTREKEKSQEEIKLLKAKTKAIESSEENSRLYKEAIEAMHRYAGFRDDEE